MKEKTYSHKITVIKISPKRDLMSIRMSYNKKDNNVFIRAISFGSIKKNGEVNWKNENARIWTEERKVK